MRNLGWISLGAAACATVAFGAQAQTTPDAEARASALVADAQRLMGHRPLGIGQLCRPIADVVAAGQALPQSIAPTKAFDNLYYVGLGFVGAWALQTSDGIILIDALNNQQDAETVIVPGLRALGLDPADVKYVFISHGHGDHYGGAKYFQDTYGAHVLMGGPDWDLAATGRVPAPTRDMSIVDGQELTLGDTTITFYATPGHTPGTTSALIPVREGANTYTLSFLGGTAFPRTIEDMQQYRQSLQRFSGIAREAGADGMISNHPLFDDALTKLDQTRSRAAGAANPFLMSAEEQQRSVAIQDDCLQAAIARAGG